MSTGLRRPMCYSIVVLMHPLAQRYFFPKKITVQSRKIDDRLVFFLRYPHLESPDWLSLAMFSPMNTVAAVVMQG